MVRHDDGHDKKGELLPVKTHQLESNHETLPPWERGIKFPQISNFYLMYLN